MMMMNDEMIARIDRICDAYMRDESRASMIIAIAQYDSIDDFLDSQFDDDFAIIDDAINDDDIAHFRNNDEFAIALRFILHSRIFALIMNK
jgi:hypothetical protein